MTVSTLANKVVYTGNGSATSFAVPFKVLDEDHLVVKRRVAATGSIDYTYIGTDYSYSGLGNDSGTLTLDGAALTSTYELVIERVIPYTQDLDIVNSGGFYPETVEEQLDLMVMQIQQIARQAGDVEERALRVRDGETIEFLPPISDLIGKYLVFDADGDPVGASGTGADDGLRVDLAGSGGAALVGWLSSATGAVSRSAASRFADWVNILDFVPVAEHAAIKARTSTTDLAVYVAAAIAHINSIGGGTLYWPPGRYTIGSTITLCRYLHMRGAGKVATHIRFTHQGTTVPNGSGFKKVEASNSSTGVYVKLSDMYVEMTHASNVGACFYDNCGTFVTLRDCIFAGKKYGVVFDQTEVSGIYSCEMQASLAGGAGLWLVNGADITVGNLGAFTNQITVDHNCQFNITGTAWAVLDDGGDCHYYGHNNYNGGGLRIAGCANLTITGGEFEAVVGRPIINLLSTSLSGTGVGPVSGIIENGLYAATGTNEAIAITSASVLDVRRNTFAVPAATAAVTGAANTNSIFARGNNSTYATVPVFDSYATSHDDGSTPIRTEAGTAIDLAYIHINSLVRCTNGGAITFTVLANADLATPIGSRIDLEQAGAGAITVAGAGGVTMNGTLTTAAQYQVLSLIKTDTNRWLSTRRA